MSVNQGRALFFANEVYLTPGAAEDIILNTQLGLGIPIELQDRAASLGEQVAFISEQLAHHEGNFGRVLWKSSKYINRTLKGTDLNMVSEALSERLKDRINDLKAYVTELERVKKSDAYSGLTGRDQAAQNLARQYPQLGHNPAEFRQKILDLHIDLQLEIQQHLQPKLP